MREILTTVGEIAGSAIAAFGLGMMSVPLGVFAGGVMLAGFSWLASR